MTKEAKPTHRTTVLPGLGQVDVPLDMSDAEVLAEVFGPATADTAATPPKKSPKMP